MMNYKKVLKCVIALLLIIYIFNFHRVYAEEKLLTVSFSESEISDALRILAEECEVNIVAGEDITGKVTISFNNVTLEDALSSILKINGYDYVKEGNIIRIIKLGQPGVHTISKVFTLKHVDANNVKDTLSNMLTMYGTMDVLVRSKGVGSEKSEGRSNVLVVTDVPRNLQKIEEVINQLDTLTSQVTIEAKIIEITLDKDADLGINWNVESRLTGSQVPTTFPFPNLRRETDVEGTFVPKPSETTTNFYYKKLFPFAVKDDFKFGTLDTSTFTALLKMISSKEKYDVLSSPRVITLDNQEAEIHIGEVIPVPKYTYNRITGTYEIAGYEDQEVGITLTVTPHISPEGYIIMKVIPEVSEIIGWVVGPSGKEEKPKISTRKTETQLRVKDGDTIVIGGLVKDKKGKIVRKVPILGSIPLLGSLFRYKKDTVDRTDLVIFITSRILTEEKIREETQKAKGRLKLNKIKKK